MGVHAMRNLPRLREIREDKAMSQRDLADVSGVAQSTIVELELNKREAQPSTTRKLAEVLGVEPVDLMRKPERKGKR